MVVCKEYLMYVQTFFKVEESTFSSVHTGYFLLKLSIIWQRCNEKYKGLFFMKHNVCTLCISRHPEVDGFDHCAPRMLNRSCLMSRLPPLH